MTDRQSHTLPEDPALAEVAASLQGAGHWGWVVDPQWRILFVTDELRLTFGGNVELAEWPIGVHMFSPEFLAATRAFRFGTTSDELFRSNFAAVGGWVLTDTPGGREELRTVVDPVLHDMVDTVEPHDEAAHWFAGAGTGIVETVGVHVFGFRVRDRDGRLAGTAMMTKPAAGMAILGSITSMGDARHYQRMLQVAKSGRRPAAILFADLEGSSPLSRRLSTASYFALGRRLVGASDAAIIEAGGIPGRHVGDGTVAFFLAETCGSESAAARACIAAARSLGASLDGVAERSGLQREDVTLRFGLHWGSTLYVGSITTGGRSEVTALGDEVNEAARIEACATGGLMLASKDLVERLDPEDADALGLDPDRITYTALGDLDTATEKARRDAPAIAVCEV